MLDKIQLCQKSHLLVTEANIEIFEWFALSSLLGVEVLQSLSYVTRLSQILGGYCKVEGPKGIDYAFKKE